MERECRVGSFILSTQHQNACSVPGQEEGDRVTALVGLTIHSGAGQMDEQVRGSIVG